MSKQVEVYFNLHKRCFSIRCGGRVIAHRNLVVLHECKFVVQPAGLRRVRETGVKNVHAFVRGEWDETSDTPWHHPSAWRVRYNPRIHDSFVLVDDQKEVSVKASTTVMLEVSEQRTPLIWAWGPW